MKRIYILLVCAIAVLQAKAQSNYYKMSVGGGAGLTIGYGDLGYQVTSPAGYGAADFYITPFISVGLEGQMGHIKGGDTAVTSAHFSNKYKAGILNVRLAAGAFMNHTYNPTVFNKLARGFYVGTGIGILKNDITDRNPQFNINPRVNQGNRKSSDAFVPANVGLNYGISEKHGYERFVVNLNYQCNFTFGEGMDGFNNNPLFVLNTHNDIYTLTSIGIKYKFGMVGYFKR